VLGKVYRKEHSYIKIGLHGLAGDGDGQRTHPACF
jgi:hypothetical protein